MLNKTLKKLLVERPKQLLIYLSGPDANLDDIGRRSAQGIVGVVFAFAPRLWGWTISFGVAVAVFWPIFLPGYRLNGGLANEIRMANGLKSAFNAALLHGQLPLWDEWVASGKAFLIFGAYPLNFLTPLELILGPTVGTSLYKIELLIVAAIGSALFLRLGSILKIRLVLAMLGFFSCILMGQMPYETGLVLSANFYLWGAAAVVTVLLRFACGAKRFVAPFLCFAFLAALGARPDVFPMLLVYLAGLVGIGFLSELLAQPRGWRNTIKALPSDLLIFVVLPFAFYAWQLPLVLDVVRTAGDRLWASPATISETLEYVSTSIQLAIGSHIVLAWVLGLAAINLLFGVAGGSLANDARRNFSVTKRGLFFLGGIAAAVLAGLNSSSLTHAAVMLSLCGAIAIVLRALLAGDGTSLGASPWQEFRESLTRQLSWRSAWVWPLTVAAVNSALVEDPSMTASAINVPSFIRVLFLLGIFYAVGRGTEDSNEPISRTVRYFLLAAALGWICRDYVSFPLYDFTNVIWAVPRDMFWYVPTLGALFALGGDAFITDLCRTIRILHSATSLRVRRLARGLQLSAGLGVVICLLTTGLFVTKYFYVSAGHSHPNEVWRHMTPSEAIASDERWLARIDLYRSAVQKCGRDARILTLPFPDIGFPGAAASEGVRDAWGYDFVSDDYRTLAEAAFHIPVGDSRQPIGYPRLYHYNVMAGVVYERFAARFPDIHEANRIYARYQLLANGPKVDPFFLQIMNVCGLMLYQPDAQLQAFEPVQAQKLWGQPILFLTQPSRQPRRVAFLPLGTSTIEERLKSLQSDDQGELEKLYGDLRMSDEELEKAGVKIDHIRIRPNQFAVTMTTNRPGILIIFDAWDPNWIATANRAPVEVSRAFIAMRAVPVAEGTSVVDLRFRPAGFLPALALSIAALAFAVWWGVRSYR